MVAAVAARLGYTLVAVTIAGIASFTSAGAPTSHSGTIYYIDCAQGNDSADARSPSTSWRTLAKVSQQVFRPGDSVLFKRGTTCSGMLWPKGSGATGSIITLGAWGDGPLPRIQSGPDQEAALKLFNQEYWDVESLELIGGQPHGLFVSGDQGVLHHIYVKNVVVHDVTGEVKAKEGGLLVISPGKVEQRFDDILVDGVTAYSTSQWAGILVGGGDFGYPPESTYGTNVVIRNSIVHDVQGDGIILFRIKNGLIENSVSWNTGMQETQTIGTPNAIWTWMCHDCMVRRNEAFLSDSPGVDGGAFDIDYGDADNTVENNFAHDTQGYCVAVFGAGWTTVNSIVRNNVCLNNGRSPRLARYQGALFLWTWNNGKLSGLRVENNKIYWNPAVDAPAVINSAKFEGTGSFENNVIRSSAPSLISSNGSLKLDGNSYEYTGAGSPVWQYAANSYTSFETYQRESGQDAHGRISQSDGADHLKTATQLHDSPESPASLAAFAGKWLLLGFVSPKAEEDGSSRGQVTFLTSVHEQFRSLGLQVAVMVESPLASQAARNLAYDWNLSEIPLLVDDGHSALQACGLAHAPSMVLISPERRIVWRNNGAVSPGELGLALRSALGEPRYAQMRAQEK